MGDALRSRRGTTRVTRLTMEEKAAITSGRLLRVAADVIAERGFAGTSVAIITAKAEVATGSFYTYFESREALLRTIITNQSQALRRQIASAVAESPGFFIGEERSFRQYFRFLREKPSFIRLLNEAEAFLPDAYGEVKSQIVNGYRKTLAKAAGRGEIRPLKGMELEGVALFMMASRHYYGQQFLPKCDRKGEIPDRIVEMYMKFIRGGLERAPETSG